MGKTALPLQADREAVLSDMMYRRTSEKILLSKSPLSSGYGDVSS